MKPQ
ncbi:hypothetical protein D030_2022A, partial [Vibrio parahaemolyticus AQ3810]|jgi:predicted HTH transcriptional regulator